MASPDVSGAPGLLPSMWRYRWVSLAIIVGTVALSALAGVLTTPPVTASADFALKNPGENSVIAPGAVGDASLGRYTQQRSQFATSDAVFEIVSQQVGGTLSDLRKTVTVDPSSGSNKITVTAQAATAEQAVRLANAVVSAYASATEAEVAARTKTAADTIDRTFREVIAARNASQSSAERLAAAQTLSDLSQKKSELQRASNVFGNGVDFVRGATMDGAKVPGPPVREVALGFILGVVIAAISAWLRADRDRRVLDPLRPEALLDAPLLAAVPREEAAPMHAAQGEGRRTELESRMSRLPRPQYRPVAAVLARRISPGLLVVFGTGSAADRSEASLNLAVAIAADGGDVLLVDADPARPLSQRLGHGLLGDTFSAGVQPDGADSVALVTIKGDISLGLLMPKGHVGEPASVSSREFVDKLVQQHADYDIVIIDMPPLETTPVAPALVGASSGILAVIPRGSDEEAVLQLRRSAELFTTPLVGFVYTNAIVH